MNNAQSYQDQTINCRDCQTAFVFEAGEQAFFAEKGFSSPTRCKPCRMQRKAQKDMQGGGGPMAGNTTTAPTPVYVEPEQGGRPRNGGGKRPRHDEGGRRNSRGYDRED